MNKVIIGFDKEREQSHKRALNNKKTALANVVDYCNEFVEIKDIKAFKSDPYDKFIELFQDKVKGHFSTLITMEKRAELCGISLSKLNSLIDAYKVIELDKDKDFNIYARTKGAEDIYKASNELIKAFYKLEELGLNINKHLLTQSVQQLIIMDAEDTTKLKPNHNRVNMF